MPNEETVALLPCPFCGGDAQDWFPVHPISADCDDAFIRCTNCDAEGPTVLCDMADDDANLHWPAARAQAITAWNTRAAAMGWRDIAEVREVLKEVRHRLPDRYNDDAALIVRVDALLATLATPPEQTT